METHPGCPWWLTSLHSTEIGWKVSVNLRWHREQLGHVRHQLGCAKWLPTLVFPRKNEGKPSAAALKPHLHFEQLHGSITNTIVSFKGFAAPKLNHHHHHQEGKGYSQGGLDLLRLWDLFRSCAATAACGPGHHSWRSPVCGISNTLTSKSRRKVYLTVM